MLRELSSSIFLFVPGTETAAVALLAMWQEARFSSVAVLALTLILISAGVIAVVQYFAGAAYLQSQRSA
jgi:ABC-type Fe3+ transport system permease subunit